MKLQSLSDDACNVSLDVLGIDNGGNELLLLDIDLSGEGSMLYLSLNVSIFNF